MFRVQKVLLTEYQEIYEPVMVESPFTLVDAYGVGLRQYQIALTGSKLLFGCDNLYKHDGCRGEPNWHCQGHGQDPEIESFDLVSMVPLDYLHFNFYRKSDRHLMMITVQPLGPDGNTERPMIFEFGRHMHKPYFWHTWREQVAMLRSSQIRYSHITGASPFSSSDIQVDEVQHRVILHVARRPSPVYSLCCSSDGG